MKKIQTRMPPLQGFASGREQTLDPWFWAALAYLASASDP